MARRIPPVLALLLLQAFLLWHSARQDSATVDEMSHLACGLYSLQTLDFRMNRVAPPLQNLVCALPVYLSQDCHLPFDNACWQQGVWNGAGDRFLEANPDNFHQLLMTGRLGTMTLSLLLSVMVFVWANACWGYRPALAVLALSVLEPNLLAHGRLVTTDTAPALLFTLTGYLAWRFVQQPRWTRLMLVGIGMGLTWYAKHTGPLLVPALFLGFGLVFRKRQETAWYTFSRLAAKCPHSLRPWLQSAATTVMISIVGLLVIWAGYGFEVGDSIPGPREPQRGALWRETQLPLQTAAYLLGWDRRYPFDSGDPRDPYWLLLRRYLPAFSHWEGFFANRQHLQTGHMAYFMGEISAGGWRSYYPVLFLIKTPLPLLILFLLGAGLLAAKRVRLDFHAGVFLAMIPLVYTGVLIEWNRVNIGYRHALPLVPYALIALAGAALAYLFRAPESGGTDPAGLQAGRRDYSNRAVLGSLLLAWTAVDVLSIHPHYLSYFNSLIGGPKNGHYYAVDSNLDWGQDLFFLKKYLTENDVRDAYLFYFGPEQYPNYYGVPCRDTKKLDHLEPGTYIVSVTLLRQYWGAHPPKFLLPVIGREPDGRAAYTLFVYRVPAMDRDSSAPVTSP
ncbi:MAG: ArnT family glycosyltransferase [bacterium]